jgi:hypothetical protein
LLYVILEISIHILLKNTKMLYIIYQLYISEKTYWKPGDNIDSKVNSIEKINKLIKTEIEIKVIKGNKNIISVS